MSAPAALRLFDGKTATDGEFSAWADLVGAERRESWPDDPPVSADRVRRLLQNRPDFEESRCWVLDADQGAGFAAYLTIARWHMDTNIHIAGFDLYVRPERRRQGIGEALLRLGAATAAEWERTLLFTGSSSRIPAGETFLRRIGARIGNVTDVNQLDVTTLPPNLLREWQESGARRAPGYRLEWHIGPYPEALIPEMVRAKEAVNLMPHGDLELEDIHFTEAHLRQMEQVLAARGDHRWCLLLRAPGEEIAGYTELFSHPERPGILNQGDTAVFPQHQNRGLGRWLKAAMLERALRERPEGRFVRTGNATSNAPMLKINREMGFRLVLSHSSWQVARASVETYLQA